VPAAPRGREPQLKPPGTGVAEARPPAAPRQAAPPQAGVQHAAAEPGPAPSGRVQVRLGSLRSPEAAREEWQRLKRENGDLLGSLRANAVSVDLGEKGIYYRIMAGPFPDAAAAERLCGEMKRRNHGCILAR
jgi:cell division septation protein DedD